jgi:hypothetical protein
MSGVAFLLISDGRADYKERTLDSAKESLPEPEHFIDVEDSSHELGFAGAIQAGWNQVIETDAEFVFHCEGDFLFGRPVPIERMVAVLERRPHLAQICLKRQAWNAQEKAAGGIVELNPDIYTQHVDRGDIYTSHRNCFSTNPCLYSAALCHQGWPQVEHSEGAFTHRLLEDPEVRFAFWGAKFDPPLVEHIGVARAGKGY